MSTRCRIGIELPDGKVRSIYCHHDGYLSGVGKMLNDHYQTAEKVEKLMDLGDISSLSETVEATYPDAYSHEDVQIREDETTADFWRYAGNCGEEFVYLYEYQYDLGGCPFHQWSYIEIPYPSSLNEALKNVR